MSTAPLRLVRPLPQPLGLYIRASRVDQKELQTFISSGAAAFNGVVFDAKRIKHQKELLTLVLERGLDAVLDPQTQPMATIGGYASSMHGLPWSKQRPHELADLTTLLQQRHLGESIARFSIEHGFTQVLAPTHLISGPDDPWLAVDIATARALRLALDNAGGSSVQIHYSLALHYEAFRTPAKRLAVLEQLRRVQAEGLWLNISGCGSDSSPTAITRYGDAAADFQALGMPIIADHAGGMMGLALLAFGAVGGLSHGVTLGERLDTGSWNRPPQGKAFAPKVRVYLPSIDLLLPRLDAERFFEAGGGRARSHFGCRDVNCCRRGVDDMLQGPARHFLYQRTRQVAGLSQIPESLRPALFLEEHVRPASDVAILATKLPLPEDLALKATKQAKRLNDLRTTLGPYAKRRQDASFAMHPITRVARGGQR